MLYHGDLRHPHYLPIYLMTQQLHKTRAPVPVPAVRHVSFVAGSVLQLACPRLAFCRVWGHSDPAGMNAGDEGEHVLSKWPGSPIEPDSTTCSDLPPFCDAYLSNHTFQKYHTGMSNGPWTCLRMTVSQNVSPYWIKGTRSQKSRW